MSPLDPHSPDSHDIATLWWWMLVVAGIVFLGAVAMLVVGWLRRGRPGLPLFGESERANVTLVIVFGIGIPIVVLVALFIVSNLYVLQKTDAPARGSTGADRDGDRPPVVVGGPLRRRRGRHRQRDPHPGRHPDRSRRPQRRRHPLLLGAGTEPEDRPDPGPAPTGSSCTPNGPAATAASAPSSAACSTPTWPSKSSPNRWPTTNAGSPPRRSRRSRRPRAEAPQGERLFMENACAGCHTIARHAGAGDDRAEPHPRRLAQQARRRHDPQHAGRTAALDRPPADDQAGQPDAGPRTLVLAVRRDRHLPLGAALMEAAAPAGRAPARRTPRPHLEGALRRASAGSRPPTTSGSGSSTSSPRSSS